MARGPEGQKRPADVIGAAITVGKIATGDIEEVRVNESARKKGIKGGRARARKLTPAERSDIAKTAANVRWKKTDG